MTSIASTNVWNSELGEFINDDHQRFAEILRDLKPTYSLEYIPKAHRTEPDERSKPWRIIDSPDGYAPYIVRYLSETDMMNPQEILAWLIEGDVVRHGADNLVQRIEARETAAKLMELKRKEDELEDIIEHVSFLSTGGRSKLHSINLGNGKKFER